MMLKMLGYVEAALCLAAICFVVSKRQWSQYWALGWFVVVRLVTNLSLAVVMHSAEQLGRATAYHTYFLIYWLNLSMLSILALFILYGVLRQTLEPLKGVRRVSSLVFQVAVAVLVLVALISAFIPQHSGLSLMMAATSQLQRMQNVFTLCVVLLLWLVMRPLGLSAGSRAFGVSLGLGLLAINDVAQTAWLYVNPELGQRVSLINGAVVCATLMIWTIYFAKREPRRGGMTLSDGSPLLRWNAAWLPQTPDAQE